jgi:transcriptional regulator with XRE-family HTH domain
MDNKSTPIPVKRALQKLGRDLRDARKRRRIPMQLASERAGISRTTLDKIEKGDEGVGVGAYVRVLFIMGMVQRFADLADSQFDRLGSQLESEKLPVRIRIPKQKRGTS